MLGIGWRPPSLRRIPLIRPSWESSLLTHARAQLPDVESKYWDGSVWRTAAADTPRFGVSGLKIEGQRANLPPNARTPFGTGWTNHAITSAVSAVGPDGVLGSALLVTEDTTTATHYTVQLASVSSGQPYAISFLVAPGTCSNVQIFGTSGVFGAEAYCNFVLSGAGSVGTKGTAVTRSNITKVGSFYWCEMVAPATSTAGASIFLTFGTASNNTRSPSFAGTSRTITVGYAQCEQGAFASTPVLPPLAAPAAALRGPDLISASLASLGIPASGAGTYLWSGVIPAADLSASSTLFSIFAAGVANSIIARRQAGGWGVNLLRGLAGSFVGSSTAAITAAVPFSVGVVVNGSGRAAMSLNGAAPIEVLGCPTTGLATLQVGTEPGGSGALFGDNYGLDVIPRPVDDATLQRLVAAMPIAA